MNGSTSVQIEKLMFWRNGSWIKYEMKASNLSLRLVCEQLLITNNTKIVESLNLNGKIKGIYKGDILILIIGSYGQETRKIKFQIKSELVQSLKILGERFPVLDHNSMQATTGVTFRFRNIEEVIQNAIGTIERKESSTMTLPSNFNNFIKLCLLDPTFPSLVIETQKILEDEVKK